MPHNARFAHHHQNGQQVVMIGGPATTKHSVGVGATSNGTTINGGLGVNTFTAGTHYDGGNYYIASSQNHANGFAAIGSCINCASLDCRVTINFNTEIGEGSTPTAICCGPTPTATWSRSKPANSTAMC
jgi:hypothetical protein